MLHSVLHSFAFARGTLVRKPLKNSISLSILSERAMRATNYIKKKIKSRVDNTTEHNNNLLDGSDSSEVLGT